MPNWLLGLLVGLFAIPTLRVIVWIVIKLAAIFGNHRYVPYTLVWSIFFALLFAIIFSRI